MFNSTSAPMFFNSAGTVTGEFFMPPITTTTETATLCSCEGCRCNDCHDMDLQSIRYFRDNRSRLHPRLVADLARLERKWPGA